MAPTARPGLTRRLRALREHAWPDVHLTQKQLAQALSASSRVAPATLASWENLANPKAPSPQRLEDYARFFATKRSVEGEPRMLPIDELDEIERERFHLLYTELSALLEEEAQTEETRRVLMAFDDGPIVIICPEVPEEARGPLADERNANHTKLHRYADADALLEVFGHIRALNPELHVLPRLPDTVASEELQNHLVILGGVGWSSTTRRILSQFRKMPIEQFEHPRLSTGEVFRSTKGEFSEMYFPQVEGLDNQAWSSEDGRAIEVNGEGLLEDVALLARLPNPFNISRSLTIFNGIHSRGVVGAVLTVTDETIRPSNEEYLARRFPAGDFALLVRVPVVSGRVLAPDLKNPEMRLFEWSPEREATGE